MPDVFRSKSINPRHRVVTVYVMHIRLYEESRWDPRTISGLQMNMRSHMRGCNRDPTFFYSLREEAICMRRQYSTVLGI